MKQSAFFLLLVFLVVRTAHSQDQENVDIFQEFKKVPLPPTPNASAIGKFGEVPVGLSTGIPSVAIPFYKYSDPTKGLGLEVCLSYHAGGHKLEDMASNVGLGWALKAGGVVSRTMRGRPDEGWNGYLSTPELPYLSTNEYDRSTVPGAGASLNQGVCYDNYADFQTIKQIAEGQIDSECDIFSFSIGSASGKFFYRKNGEVQLVTQSNVKIQWFYGTGNSSFLITDDHGIKYYFNQAEWTEVVDPVGGDPLSIKPPHISSWYISKIESADGKDFITFNYTSGATLQYEGSFSESYKSQYYGTEPTNTAGTHSFNYFLSAPSRVSSIDLPDGTKVRFEYDFSRVDYTGDKALTTVFITNGGAEKRFNLNYSYFETPPCSQGNGCPWVPFSYNDYYRRLKLVSVQETDGVNSVPAYTFEYNSTPLPPRSAKAHDWWGYYNGTDIASLQYTLPVSGSPNYTIFNANRNSSEHYMKAWNLEKIYYPTGGHTRFYYEANDGFCNNTYKAIGGLRVQKTEDFDPLSGNFLVTEYTYRKVDNSSSGTFSTDPWYSLYWSVMMLWDGSVVIGYEHHLNQTMGPTQSLTYFNGSPVVYTRVKVEKKANGLNNGHTIYEFTAAAATSVPEVHYPFVQKQEIDWAQGLPTKEVYYNATGDPVKSVENEYDYFNYLPAVTTDGNARNLNVGLVFRDNRNTLQENLYGARAYVMMYGRSHLKKTTEKLFGQLGVTLTNVTEYTYDPLYYLPVKTKVTNSKGNELETRTYYPFNYSTTGLLMKTGLLAANRIGEVISTETWEKKGATYFLKGAKVTDYASYLDGMIKPSVVSALEIHTPLGESVVGGFNSNQLKRHSSFKDQVEFTKYDSKGRFVEMKGVGDYYSSLLWGTGNQFPVASFTNARANQIAYTSFEDNGFGNWVPASGYLLNTYPQGAVTGSTSFTGTLSATVPSGNYTVTAWSATGVAVNGSSGTWKKSGPAGWSLYEWDLTGVSSVLVTSQNVDELRLYPKGAQVTTFTYHPLRGVTSQCDANNKVTYFEYDGLSRLHLVRDEKKNILKKICYNYQGQLENCSGTQSTPQWVPTNQTACKPCVTNSTYYSNIRIREEKDMNPGSPTYNTYRWVDDGTSTSCAPQADWQVKTAECEVVNGVKTGNYITILEDKNPCSQTYKQTNQITTQDHSMCPPPSNCNTVNCSGPDKKCINDACQIGMKIYTACVYNESTGLWDSTYHYEWSDGSWSQNYYETSPVEVPIM